MINDCPMLLYLLLVDIKKALFIFIYRMPDYMYIVLIDYTYQETLHSPTFSCSTS